MHSIDTIYIDGAFVIPHGAEWFDLHNPATAQVIAASASPMRRTHAPP